MIANCEICKDEYIKRTESHATCPKKECRKLYSKRRMKILNWKQAAEMKERSEKTSAKEFKITTVIKAAIIHDMIRDFWKTYCEICGPSKPVENLQLHHIIFRSEVPRHPQKHSRINTILLHPECHMWLHEKKSNRDSIIRKRKLWEIFPEKIRKEFYQ